MAGRYRDNSWIECTFSVFFEIGLRLVANADEPLTLADMASCHPADFKSIQHS